jgi:hypothetical protein
MARTFEVTIHSLEEKIITARMFVPNASTGGTCFGDSGGPNYLGSSTVIAAETSFGRNGNCAGTGGVFRLDRQNVLDFVRPFLN